MTSGPDEMHECGWCGDSYWITEGKGSYCCETCQKAAYEQMATGNTDYIKLQLKRKRHVRPYK